MALTHLTKNDFDQAVNAGDDLVVVDSDDFLVNCCNIKHKQTDG